MLTMTDAHTAPINDALHALDLSVLEKMVGNDAAKFNKFARLFITSMQDVLQQIDDAMARSDLAALSAMGHRAKSTALNIGASGFSEQCRLLEKAAGAGDSATSLALAQSLRPLFEVIRQTIEQRLTA
jgi:two-component system sensor histidine kinase/response regulator